ncbi:MAG: rhodanese-like domain-containing protein [Chloroflexota bacterium]
MSKGKSQQQNSNGTVLIVVAAVAVLAIVAAIFVLSRPATVTAQKITPEQYQQQFANVSHVLIDVRTADEYASGHIAGAINIPVQTLPDQLTEVPHGKPVIVYCHGGNRSGQAANILDKAGYTQIYDMQGGLIAWSGAGLPLVN